jgi:hypothetical protein
MAYGWGQKFKCGAIESYDNLKAFIELGGKVFSPLGAGCVLGTAHIKGEDGVYYPNLWTRDTIIHLGSTSFAYRPCFGADATHDYDRSQVHNNTIYVQSEEVDVLIGPTGGCPAHRTYTLEDFQRLGKEPGSRRIIGYPSSNEIMASARATLGQFSSAAADRMSSVSNLAAHTKSAIERKSAAQDRPTAKPDVVFILADDLGYNELNFMNETRGLQTPHLDALAHSGVTLKNYYVGPICSPTRSALMTGRYMMRLGTQANVIYWDTPWGVSLDETFIGEHFKAAGYNTALCLPTSGSNPRSPSISNLRSASAELIW